MSFAIYFESLASRSESDVFGAAGSFSSNGVEVAGVVDSSVVEAAQGDGLVQIGFAAVLPGLLVMQLRPGVGPLVSRCRAGVVGGGQDGALGVAEEPTASSQIQRD